MNTINVTGQIGYMAPEYLYRGEISTKADIYSLGMLILELATRDKNVTTHADMASRKFVQNVYKNWNRDDRITARYPLLDANGLQQVKTCIEIGLRCVEVDKDHRPSIVDIINKISPVDGTNRHSMGKDNNNVSKDNTSRQIMRISTELLDVYPGQVGLPVKPDKLIASCSLQLSNKTDDCIGIRLLTKNRKMYMARMPLCCVVPARSTYVLVITTAEQKKLPPNNIEEILTLESSIILECELNKSLKNSNLDSMNMMYEQLFKQLKEADVNNVHELRLKVISDPPEEENSCQIKCGKKFSQVLSVDVHPAEPWIMTSHHTGEIFIWDYEEQATMVYDTAIISAMAANLVVASAASVVIVATAKISAPAYLVRKRAAPTYS
ncbi:hypothetical protein PR202_ga30716 [Eleusine coracana subsp. coracana]|uniref:Protein kinase domain-containing protein n=1 Tax=Eleusine coracana subsp. coracana TaxID=191504 RepID=A0AAV5DPJ1_ELECO|nr:hypothetical protein PR202_ga30716 [Eleusine coracana subsp. coracana]